MGGHQHPPGIAQRLRYREYAGPVLFEPARARASGDVAQSPGWRQLAPALMRDDAALARRDQIGALPGLARQRLEQGLRVIFHDQHAKGPAVVHDGSGDLECAHAGQWIDRGRDPGQRGHGHRLVRVRAPQMRIHALRDQGKQLLAVGRVIRAVPGAGGRNDAHHIVAEGVEVAGEFVLSDQPFYRGHAAKLDRQADEPQQRALVETGGRGAGDPLRRPPGHRPDQQAFALRAVERAIGSVRRRAFAPDERGGDQRRPEGVGPRLDLRHHAGMVDKEGLALHPGILVQGALRFQDEHQQRHRRREDASSKHQQTLRISQARQRLDR
ncbi:hypothetical protein D3C72_1325420 [compost metagenome]